MAERKLGSQRGTGNTPCTKCYKTDVETYFVVKGNTDWLISALTLIGISPKEAQTFVEYLISENHGLERSLRPGLFGHGKIGATEPWYLMPICLCDDCAEEYDVATSPRGYGTVYVQDLDPSKSA